LTDIKNKRAYPVQYKAVVVGVSTGGLTALKKLLAPLPANFPLPVVIVQHISPYSDNNWVARLNDETHLLVKEADEKEKMIPGVVYIAPANYHLMVEKDETFSLNIHHRENYSRPAIDVLFESAADTFGNNLIAIILTGANSDGAKGLKTIKEAGGLAIVQEPGSAEAQAMPLSAIAATKVDYVLTIENIVTLLIQLT
jgi:two-component system chemotaxis response regulator CheB